MKRDGDWLGFRGEWDFAGLQDCRTVAVDAAGAVDDGLGLRLVDGMDGDRMDVMDRGWMKLDWVAAEARQRERREEREEEETRVQAAGGVIV